ncbi:DUF3885 domain-containing protein [Sporosarcina sp. NPDC096371]|uniref:DUF3885 domain-containing protein n=1 Tax=Sporosarcina sp. NPDC096371 TaxID=3364530 RepID=UPI0037FD131F
MTTIENQFMNEHFNNLPLRPPLFYSWEYGIRFEISMPAEKHEDTHNLQQINERSSGIFNHVFQDTDELLLITDIHCDKKDTFLRKKPVKVYQKYVRNKRLINKLQHRKFPNVFSEDDADYEKMLTHRFVLSCKKSDIRYHQLLSAISYEDFPHPTRILKQNYQAGYDIYFINVTRKMIYHFYDDRGCDVIAADKEDLRHLYTTCNDWILDYDRDQIDQLFQPIS